MVLAHPDEAGRNTPTAAQLFAIVFTSAIYLVAGGDICASRHDSGRLQHGCRIPRFFWIPLCAAIKVAETIGRLPLNYADNPYLLDGFYRDIKSVNNTYISLLEAAVNIFDNNHEEPRNPFKIREKVRLLQIRKSLGYNHKYVEYFDQGNLLEMLLLNNTIRYYDGR